MVQKEKKVPVVTYRKSLSRKTVPGQFPASQERKDEAQLFKDLEDKETVWLIVNGKIVKKERKKEK